MSTLVIVPCGHSKIWDTQPDQGWIAAKDAYVGIAFRRNREYADCFADRWMILSAKYGLIHPGFLIPGAYDVTFNDSATHPVSVAVLQEQVVEYGLDEFERVVALGGKAYRIRLEQAFAGTSVIVVAPFAGLGIGKYLQAVTRATASGDAQIDRLISK